MIILYKRDLGKRIEIIELGFGKYEESGYSDL
jgi:hypothetical protein